MSSVHTERDGTQGKACSACGEWKPLGAFGMHRCNPDGLNCRCKECCRAACKRTRTQPGMRTKHAARMRAYRQTPSGRDANYRASRSTRTQHHERMSAGSAVAHAVTMGRLPRASACECVDCGQQAEHYHHESYAKEKWLDVVPLCRACHNKRHGNLQYEAAA